MFCVFLLKVQMKTDVFNNSGLKHCSRCYSQAISFFSLVPLMESTVILENGKHPSFLEQLQFWEGRIVYNFLIMGVS